MSILDRDALAQSPLADLHAIASELSIDGYRRLRKAELVELIVRRQEAPGGARLPDPGDRPDLSPSPAEASPAPRASEDDERPRRRTAEDDEGTRRRTAEDDDEPADTRRRRGRRGGRGRAQARDEDAAEVGSEPEDRPEPQEREEAEDELVEGQVELLPNGSGFVRVTPPEPSDEDVYISAAQVKRCELVSGDRVSGPRRAPRRSERFASLIRVDTINGGDASELASGTRFDDLPAAFPDERFRLGSEDPTVKAIEFLTPLGKGSRVIITGAARAGKSEALRRVAQALARHEDLQVSVVLVGVRPEEIAEWSAGGPAPAAALSFAASADSQDHTVELVIDQARRITARGADAVVLLDTVDGLHPQAARKALAAARNIVDGGSLTVIATATAPVGGETTVIALDLALASTGRFPALDLAASGTLRPELLVGEAGAQAIAQARAEALDR